MKKGKRLNNTILGIHYQTQQSWVRNVRLSVRNGDSPRRVRPLASLTVGQTLCVLPGLCPVAPNNPLFSSGPLAPDISCPPTLHSCTSLESPALSVVDFILAILPYSSLPYFCCWLPHHLWSHAPSVMGAVHEAMLFFMFSWIFYLSKSTQSRAISDVFSFSTPKEKLGNYNFMYFGRLLYLDFHLKNKTKTKNKTHTHTHTLKHSVTIHKTNLFVHLAFKPLGIISPFLELWPCLNLILLCDNSNCSLSRHSLVSLKFTL